MLSSAANDVKKVKTTPVWQARIEVVRNVLAQQGQIYLRDQEYRNLRFWHGLTRREIDQAVNHLVEQGQAMLEPHAVGAIVRPVGGAAT